MTKLLSRFWDLYRGHFRVTIVRYLAYRVELVIWLVSMVLQPVVFLAVWQSAVSQVGGQLAGFTRGDVAAYFIAVMLINHLTMAWVMFEWEGRVLHGDLSYLLLRPHHVIHRDLGENITFKTATFPVMLATAVILGYSFHLHYEFVLWAFVAFFPSLVLAYFLRFLSDWTCAMGALYTTKVEAINAGYFFLMLLFSGQMAPISLLPAPIQRIASFMPFRWMIDFPARLLMGRLTVKEMQQGFLAQAAWLIVVGGCCAFIWRRGMRRYTAVGL